MIDRIAIVGLGLRLPGAGADPAALLTDVTAAADRSGDVPAGRWHLPPDRCLDPRVPHPDAAPHSRGYYLDPFTPDLSGLEIDPAFVAELDPLFHTVLDAGGRAWRSAKTGRVDRSRVGVVLGNIGLPTDKANALCREYLGPQAGRPVPPRQQGTQAGVPVPLEGIVARASRPVQGPVARASRPVSPLNRYVAGLPAGVLARALGLGGGSYTLDAACASSLYAIKLAADELLAGRADAMLAGGANGADPQYTQLGFAQLRALSAAGRCAPFDARADGLMVGEGAAVFVLKRLADAVRDGDHIHAVIAGVGLSNDRHGNLLAPAKEGQLRAMRRAYARAGWRPQDVDLIECHATATPVGDAVEFDSLRELWGDDGWAPGRCAIGSVKSTVGHLLTGAGAAAVAKVVGAMGAGVLPPQANFAEPAPGLKYAGGPFRVLTAAEPWDRRSPDTPRRAAVSGFGFGGVNAHLLLEEWTGDTTPQAHGQPPVGPPIAVVGMAAHFGPWDDLRKFQERVFGADDTPPSPKTNGWGLAGEPCPPGYYIEELSIPVGRFRIPPKELEDALPQQLVMLSVAAAALDDCRSAASCGTGVPPVEAATGAFVGLGLDLNTTNYHLRWSVLASGGRDPDAASPPLTANRVMGALGSIAASRVARAFGFGGPSHTVCSEEASAARAVELGVRALQAGEIDRALVGGVDLAGDPRLVLPGEVELPGEGAAAFVLKRLADAERDGDRVYAVITGVGAASSEAAATDRAGCGRAIRFDAAADVGHAGAASAGASLAMACLALYQEVLPQTPPPNPLPRGERGDRKAALPPPPFVGEGAGGRGLPGAGGGAPAPYWLHDRADGPRRAAVVSAGADGSHVAFAVEEYEPNTREEMPTAERVQPLGARAEAAFVVEAADAGGLLAGLARLDEFAAARRTRNIEAVARGWLRAAPPDAPRRLAVGLVARSADELAEQVAFAARSLRADPAKPFPADPGPAIRDRVFYSPDPLGPGARVASVFPGSGNQFDGMGRDLAAQFPEVMRRQQRESALLRSQFAPEHFWFGRADAAPARDLMFGQVTVGSLAADVVSSLGVRCDAMIGLSLGESAGLFGVRAWRDRDEMFRRMQRSTLFNSDLAPPYDAARAFFGERVDWVSGVVAASADEVNAALRPGGRAYLLIVNTPAECVIGGARADVEELAARVGRPFFPLSGVTLAHCEAGRPVEGPYRELHTLPATPPAGVAVYSGAWGRRYDVTSESAAASITAGLVGPIDVPRVVRAAYADGVRVFVEVGPGGSCTRMVGDILAGERHLARAAHAKGDAVSQVLRLVASLAAERVPVGLAALYGRETRCVGHREPAADPGPTVVVPVGMRPVEPEPVVVLAGGGRQPPVAILTPVTVSAEQGADAPRPPGVIPFLVPAIEAAVAARVAAMQAQESFLRVNQRLMESAAGVARFQGELLQRWLGAGRAGGVSPLIPEPIRGLTPPARQDVWEQDADAPRSPGDVPRALTFEQCCRYATGRIGDVLGPLYAEADAFPTRVRLPDGPLQLVDAITLIEGEPKSMTRGRVVTTHAVRADRWYLEAGRIPTAISVEAGQADLFLSGFLGIDFRTRGLAVYRLLDAVVTFHRGLPAVGETVVYDIAIDEFVKQGDAWLFRFRFDGTVNGEPYITMRNGVAGFFTADALAAGKGIVQTALDRQQLPGQKPDDWQDLVPPAVCSLDATGVEALRRGDLVAAFGPAFAAAALSRPLPLPGGMLRLVDHVPVIDPAGGRFGLGFARAEFLIHPDDWFLTCHFVDDRVMPGTLMYECCLHTLRILLTRLGWVGEAGEVAWEPVPGVNSRLKCRGQVLDTTKTVTYEVTVREVGFRPEPYCLADALMYADGKPIVEITNMALQLSGSSRETLGAIWGSVSPRTAARGRGGALYDSASILAFSNGNPSEAFGEPYRVFDRDRVIARLPGPPFQFLDRVVAVTGGPFVLTAGASCETEYDVPADAWYFAEGGGAMPFSVLLEVALQPCGWLAAYCGSALASPEDLKFRNLGGKATQLRPVTPDSGTLTVAATMRDVSRSAGMIIQHYTMRVSDRAGAVYEGTTYFGFFTKAQLADQVGIREAKVPWPSAEELARAERAALPVGRPFPGPMLRMVDRIEYVPDGGAKGLGLAVGRIAVDPGFWFFQAHFFQDPVWPGSLGLESFLQVLKYVAWKRWGLPRPSPLEGEGGSRREPGEGNRPVPSPPSPLPQGEGGWQAVALNRPHAWTYRGQVLPTDGEVAVVLEVTAADDAAGRLAADGFLTVDGRVIYQMADFTLE
ncbi:MAG: hypothetical protein K2X87_15395 [Gemmataceae bacterium]|nr:hypothetical protein [Gemmataceae bacterium]